jgi:predicted MPP superfamily phosphohydrolase
MRTLIHLSDLHFGRVDQALLGPLRELVHAIAADVVVISGDLLMADAPVLDRQ